mmetsp:Transcript_48125/g.96397  ORF Transcript_48125/g.96397 Transcript_48125/m.96397 type:complete len:85 (+) Transcript_48125:70-324(+)
MGVARKMLGGHSPGSESNGHSPAGVGAVSGGGPNFYHSSSLFFSPPFPTLAFKLPGRDSALEPGVEIGLTDDQLLITIVLSSLS